MHSLLIAVPLIFTAAMLSSHAFSPLKFTGKAKGYLSVGGGGEGTQQMAGCGPGVQTLTLFKTQFSDFSIPFKTEFKIFRPYLFNHNLLTTSWNH